jgi:hypothetical protein
MSTQRCVNAPLGWQSTRADGSRARSQVRRGRSGAAYWRAGFIGCRRPETIREDFIMGVKLGFLVALEAKDGKGEELGAFLRAGREFAAAEEEEALGKAAGELLASDPSIRPVDLIAVK